MLNRVILQGRLVRDIEVQEVGGFPMTEFTVAWSEKYNDYETKCFMKCKAWRATAEHLSRYFTKGKELIIEGKMVTDEWEKDGEKKSKTYCTVDKVHFCGSKTSGSDQPPKTPDDTSFMTIPDTDDEELPFE